MPRTKKKGKDKKPNGSTKNVRPGPPRTAQDRPGRPEPPADTRQRPQDKPRGETAALPHKTVPTVPNFERIQQVMRENAYLRKKVLQLESKLEFMSGNSLMGKVARITDDIEHPLNRYHRGLLPGPRYIRIHNITGKWQEISKDEWERL